METLLAVEGEALRVPLKKFLVNNPQVETKIFAAMHWGTKTFFSTYWCTKIRLGVNTRLRRMEWGLCR